MRTRCFSTLGQRLLPRALRIPPGPVPCCPVSPATAFALALASVTPAAPPPTPLPPPPEQLPEGVAVELCNFLHRIGMGVRELRAVEGAGKGAAGLGLALEQMRQRLKTEASSSPISPATPGPPNGRISNARASPAPSWGSRPP